MRAWAPLCTAVAYGIAASAAWAQAPGHAATEGQDVMVPLAVVIAGLAVAYVMLHRQTSGDEGVEVESRRIDMRSTVDEAVEALKALELEKPKMDPQEYEAEREALVARGAHAMAALDGEEPREAPQEREPDAPAQEEPAASTAPPASAPSRGGLLDQLGPEWRGALAALAVVGVVGAFWYFASAGSNVRTTDMGMTGGEIVNRDNEGAAASASAQLQKQREAFEKQLEENPEDMVALNQLTGLYLNLGQPREAMDHNDRALKVDPKDLTARSYRAVLSMMMGMRERALQQIDEVLAEDPEHAMALPYRGLFLMELGRFEEAVTVLERAIEVLPGNPALRNALADARIRTGAPAAPGAPPGQAAGGGELIVSGTVELDEASKAVVTGGEVVFVSVKDPSRPGPPVAADRIPAVFPATFELTTADIRAMPGSSGAVPASLTLTVRVDRDGNAMTRENAPMAVVSGVARGTSDLPVTLTLTGAASPAPAAPAPSAAASGGQVLVSGVASLGPGATAQPGQTVFLSVRDPAGGPPLAADKRAGVSFPLEFALTSAHILPMAGNRPVPEQLEVTVRLDNDGDALSKEGEPAATSAVTKGATGVELTLQ